MSRHRHARLALGLGACLFLASGQLGAQVPAADSAKTESREAGARRHFDRALELYRAGRYADALTELEQAAALDPKGKDLFFNLSLVHEKLGQLPEAIVALERFRELETDSSERERARLTIERLRGAEQTAATLPATPADAPCVRDAAAPEAALPRGPSPVLVGAGAVAAVSLLVGTVFGLKAWSDDVHGERTSPSFPIDQLRERARRAEREALVADVAFALSAASATTLVGIWLLSPREPSRGAAVTLRGYF
jgi:tetratricopeptide (TPR) repeat protein